MDKLEERHTAAYRAAMEKAEQKAADETGAKYMVLRGGLAGAAPPANRQGGNP